MLPDLKRLGRETLIYGVSTVFGRLLNFVLTPFYTHVLAPAEYGVIATVFACLAFLNAIYQRGMDQAYLRFATDQRRDDVFSTSVASVIVSSLFISGILVLAAPLTSYFQVSPTITRLCAAILLLDAAACVPFAELRRSHRAWSYAWIKTLNIVVNVGLNVLFLWKLRMGVEGVFWASFGAAAATFAALIPASAALLRPKFDGRLHAELLRFATPFVPAGLASMAVQVIDRPIVQALAGLDAAGIYQANYRLGIFMLLVTGMFDAAWRPFFLERADKPGAKELFGRVFTLYLAGAIGIALALSLFIGDIARIKLFGHPLIHPAYWSGLVIVPVILAAYVFDGAYINFMAPVVIAKRTEIIAQGTALAAAVNVAANLALIPLFGLMGAAAATLSAYMVAAAYIYRKGRPLYPIPYETENILIILLSAAAAALLAFAFSRVVESGAAWFLARVLSLGLFALCLWRRAVAGAPARAA